MFLHRPDWRVDLVHRRRPIGGLDMADEKGPDFKVLAVPTGDPRFANTWTLDDLSPHWLREIETFFSTYKKLEGEQVKLAGWRKARTAWDLIDKSRKRA